VTHTEEQKFSAGGAGIIEIDVVPRILSDAVSVLIFDFAVENGLPCVPELQVTARSRMQDVRFEF